jgi:hypothetical protein
MKIAFEDSLTIQASAERVWLALSKWEDPSGWVPQLKSCVVLDPPGTVSGVGAGRRIVEEDQTLTEHVVQWDGPRRIGIRVEGVPPIVRKVVTTFWVAPIDDGNATFGVTAGSETGLGLIGVALAPFAKRAQRTELRRLLVAMKHFLESGARATHADVNRLFPKISSFR